jgi:hypothetical protein
MPSFYILTMIVMKVGRLDRRWSFGKHQCNIIQRKKNKLATKITIAWSVNNLLQVCDISYGWEAKTEVHMDILAVEIGEFHSQGN